ENSKFQIANSKKKRGKHRGIKPFLFPGKKGNIGRDFPFLHSGQNMYLGSNYFYPTAIMISSPTPGKFYKSSSNYFYERVKVLCIIGVMGILTGCVDKKQENKEESEEVPSWLVLS